MRRLAPPLVVALAIAVAGCGEDDRSLLDQARSEQLMAAVDRIEAACQDQDVVAAQAAVDEASAQVSELPRRVDDGLQDNLREWLDHISGRLDRDCAPQEEETPAPEPTPTATESPEPTPTETPEPTPPPEEPPPPPEEVPTPPAEEEPPPGSDPGGGVPTPDVPGEAP